MAIGTYGVLRAFIYKDGYGAYNDYHAAFRSFIQFLYTRGPQTFYLTRKYKKLNIHMKATRTCLKGHARKR